VDFSHGPDDLAFRDELVAWLDENLPKFLAEWDDGDGEVEAPAGGSPEGIMRGQERRRAWQRLLHSGRWAAITWPEAWGGRDATVAQNVIYSEVMARYRTPGVFNANGLWQIGPMIIKWGTDEQKDLWLNDILSGDTHWCQGFSEPQAGSDLAALSTTAIRDGDEYVVNGRKIWISTAHIAQWGLFLVRTDPDALAEGRRHDGITAFIVPMETPGIEITPIRDIVGDEMFCEVAFDDARVPADCRLGAEGEGWQVAMGTLGSERVGTAGLAIGMKADLEAMVSAAKALNPAALGDPAIVQRVARAHIDIEFTRLLNYRALSKILRGEKNWPEVPIAKLQWSHLAQTLAELAVDLLGPQGLMARGAPDAVDGGSWNRLYVFQRYTSIGAGTTEVQKNIIADRAIKMPRR